MRILGLALLFAVAFFVVVVSTTDDASDNELSSRIEDSNSPKAITIDERPFVNGLQPLAISVRRDETTSVVSSPLDRSSKKSERETPILVTIEHVRNKLPVSPMFYRTVSGRSVLAHATPMDPYDSKTHLGVYRLLGFAAGDSLTIAVSDVARTIEIDDRRNYFVRFHDKIPIVFQVIGELAVLREFRGDLELRYSTNNNESRLHFDSGRQTEVRLEPGEYEISLALVSSNKLTPHVTKIGTVIDLSILSGASLIIVPEDKRLIHQIVLEQIEFCELSVTGVGEWGVVAVGPLALPGASLTKKKIWHSQLSPVATFWLKPGEYQLFGPKKQMAARQKVKIQPGDLRRSVAFKPSKISGVAVILKNGHRVFAESQVLQSGDTIRGLNGRRIGKDLSFVEYGREIVKGLAKNLETELLVERASGKLETVRLNIKSIMISMGADFEFRPTVD